MGWFNLVCLNFQVTIDLNTKMLPFVMLHTLHQSVFSCRVTTFLPTLMVHFTPIFNA
jgi:hypothetical protein